MTTAGFSQNPPDDIRKMINGDIQMPPVAKLIGFNLTSMQPGQAVIELETTDRHANPMGTLHGGILCDIADAVMGIAYASLLQEGETFTTLELKINFLKPVWKAKLQAEGRVVSSGKTIGLVECDVIDEKHRLVARASSTCMTLRGERAQGR
jgi:uncharacterized protein (TIGR00369 family)